MDAVQRLLSELGVGVLEAIAVTRRLIDPPSLPPAVDGAAAAGKTALVRATTNLLHAAWTLTGTFHARADWRHLRDQVLAPLRAGRGAPTSTTCAPPGRRAGPT